MAAFARALGALMVYCLPLAALGQAKDSVRWLREVAIYGIPEAKFAAGSKIFRPDSTALAQLSQGTLADLLMQQTSVYLREYGSGMLASVSFRGTSPNHTALLWNGINLNQPTLGQIDYNIVPLTIVDQVEVQTGGACSLYGSDALGGSIHLNSRPSWQPGAKLSFQQTVGSFGRYFTNLQAKFTLVKWELRTNLYHNSAQNDFPFVNITKVGAPVERQVNAATLNYGLVQEIFYRFSSNRYFSLKGWHNANDRQIQPNMAVAEIGDEQQDENTRIVADYHDHSRWGYFHAKLAFVRDWMLYNQSSRIATNRYWAVLEYEKRLGKKVTLQAGANWQHIVADVQAYRGGVNENRNDVFALLRYAPSARWILTANVRQAFVTAFPAPLAPSLGSEVKCWQEKDKQLKIKTVLSRNYRVPTLNDRFWQPGGNLAIRPELGYSAELGLHYQQGKPGKTWELEATHYRMWVDDWIIWLPQTSFWSPRNIRRVQVVGAELSGKFTRKWGRFFFIGGGQYAYTQSTNRNQLNENDRALGKQLPYVPRHRATAYLNAGRGMWYANVNFNYTSQRFVSTDNDEALAAFHLWNLGGGRLIHLTKKPTGARLNLSVNINNAANANYQNLRLRAMPGRNYQASVRVDF
jgi:iron complex outermembrane receptor protein